MPSSRCNHASPASFIVLLQDDRVMWNNKSASSFGAHYRPPVTAAPPRLKPPPPPPAIRRYQQNPPLKARAAAGGGGRHGQQQQHQLRVSCSQPASSSSHRFDSLSQNRSSQSLYSPSQPASESQNRSQSLYSPSQPHAASQSQATSTVGSSGGENSIEAQLHILTCQVAELKEKVGHGHGGEEAIQKLVSDSCKSTTDSIQAVTATVRPPGVHYLHICNFSLDCRTWSSY